MKSDGLQKDADRLSRLLLPYLSIQLVLMLMTYLDQPVYLAAYRAEGVMTVTGWLGVWLALALFGPGMCVFLLVRKGLRGVLAEKERANLLAGYLLGFISGLAAVGLRFMPVMPVGFFHFVALFLLALVLAFFTWKWLRNKRMREEIFP